MATDQPSYRGIVETREYVDGDLVLVADFRDDGCVGLSVGIRGESPRVDRAVPMVSADVLDQMAARAREVKR
jgi:hypothetical protein